MKYKINSTGQVILADLAFVQAYHPGDFEEVPESAASLRRAEILARLDAIDAATDKPRTRRELALSKAATKAWLQILDDEAVALRTELATLP